MSNRNYVPIDLDLIDSTGYRDFILDPNCWATYLILRRNIWRSDKKHAAGLEGLWAQKKYAVEALSAYIAAYLKIDEASVVAAIDSLEKRHHVIERDPQSAMIKRDNVFVLGYEADTGTEVWYFDRLTKAQPEAKTGNPYTRVIDRFHVAYLTHRKEKYVFERSKDGKHIKDLLVVYDEGLIGRCIDEFFTSDNEFLNRIRTGGGAGYTIGIFRSMMKSLADAIKTREAKQGEIPNEW